MSGVTVVSEDLTNHPRCPHGPTLLFSLSADPNQRFFACSACRDRKLCPFYLQESNLDKFNKVHWEGKAKEFIKNVNHRALFHKLSEVRLLGESQRIFCRNCSTFEAKKSGRHTDHHFITGVSDYQLNNPTTFLPPLEDSKREAQYLFTDSSIKTIVNIFKLLKFKKIICMGTPKIHEFLSNNEPDIDSILLDFDSRFLTFYSPLEFCWYNSFNHHFFLPNSKPIFNDFLTTPSNNVALILDPPFGGRTEPLAQTIQAINKQYKEVNNFKDDLASFWVFPYFMEPQIVNQLRNWSMLDYKVGYTNHPLFQEGARHLGSPVRIFTNVKPSLIPLPSEEGYRLCEECRKFVAPENKHCPDCKLCTSKDGRTYVHCFKCKRCVKPTWKHCDNCKRCAQIQHNCGKLPFQQNCLKCQGKGHKRAACPLRSSKNKRRRN